MRTRKGSKKKTEQRKGKERSGAIRSSDSGGRVPTYEFTRGMIFVCFFFFFFLVGDYIEEI